MIGWKKNTNEDKELLDLQKRQKVNNFIDEIDNQIAKLESIQEGTKLKMAQMRTKNDAIGCQTLLNQFKRTQERIILMNKMSSNMNALAQETMVSSIYGSFVEKSSEVIKEICSSLRNSKKIERLNNDASKAAAIINLRNQQINDLFDNFEDIDLSFDDVSAQDSQSVFADVDAIIGGTVSQNNSSVEKEFDRLEKLKKNNIE